VGSVLIADDSSVARKRLCTRLGAAGVADIVLAISRDTALECVDEAELACALLDIDLGDGFGTDVARSIRARGSRIPVAFFTSSATRELRDEATTFGPVFDKHTELEDAVAWVRANCVNGKP
jgi:CheY-like chemotaxis protein